MSVSNIELNLLRKSAKATNIETKYFTKFVEINFARKFRSCTYMSITDYLTWLAVIYVLSVLFLPISIPSVIYIYITKSWFFGLIYMALVPGVMFWYDNNFVSSNCVSNLDDVCFPFSVYFTTTRIMVIIIIIHIIYSLINKKKKK